LWLGLALLRLWCRSDRPRRWLGWVVGLYLLLTLTSTPILGFEGTLLLGGACSGNKPSA
jgi:hypothetical protein